jgi:hypothetical protein
MGSVDGCDLQRPDRGHPLQRAAAHHSFYVPPLVHLRFRGLSLHLVCFRVDAAMQNRTETLQVGSRAPEFTLEPANREGILTLSGFLQRGKLILEFLRGTW